MYSAVCPVCQQTFTSRRRRRWCGQSCYDRSRGKTPVARYVAPESAKLADEAQKKGNGSWLHQRIYEWYVSKHAERLAQGVRQPIPLAKVLHCHEQGLAAFAPLFLVKIAASLEDSPGPKQESGDDED